MKQVLTYNLLVLVMLDCAIQTPHMKIAEYAIKR